MADDLEEITGFILARLAEHARTAELFHERGCPGSRSSCQCPVPAQIRDQADIAGREVRHCEQQIRTDDIYASGWPHTALGAWKTLGAFALPYEMHPSWRERWRP